MAAWAVSNGRLERVDRDPGEPGPGQILVRVSCCGVCRTDLHLLDGDLPARHPDVVPGHEVVGRVAAAGDGARPGSRSVTGWASPGWPRPMGPAGSAAAAPRTSVWRRASPAGTATAGTRTTVWPRRRTRTRLPSGLDDEQAAPLLCAGIIGYRALVCAAMPAGGTLGIYGFGGSAHLTAQVAIAQGLRVHVRTRGAAQSRTGRSTRAR